MADSNAALPPAGAMDSGAADSKTEIAEPQPRSIDMATLGAATESDTAPLVTPTRARRNSNARRRGSNAGRRPSNGGRRSSVTRGRRGSASRGRRASVHAAPIEQDSSISFKEKVWALVDDPSSSKWARFVAVFIMSLIGLSCVTFCMETLPQFHRKNVEVWFAIEVVCIFFFTLEYLTRLLSCPKLLPFLKDTLNTIDLVAIVPFYIELIWGDTGGSSAVFRVVRLVRVFRVFKISRYVSWVKIFGNAMYSSAQPLGMLLFVMSIGCVVFSSAIYFMERGDWDDTAKAYIRSDGKGSTEISPYQSIPASFWWCIVTMTTVGYGDDVPVTTVGKLIAAVASLSGILVLAIPITVISTNFNYEFSRMKKRREAMRQKMLMFKRQFGTTKKTQGLDMIKDEIDAMIRRSTTELMEDFQNVTQSARDELAGELFDLVQIAYKQRQRMLQQEEENGGAVSAAASGPAAKKYIQLNGSDAPPEDPALEPKLSAAELVTRDSQLGMTPAAESGASEVKDGPSANP